MAEVAAPAPPARRAPGVTPAPRTPGSAATQRDSETWRRRLDAPAAPRRRHAPIRRGRRSRARPGDPRLDRAHAPSPDPPVRFDRPRTVRFGASVGAAPRRRRPRTTSAGQRARRSRRMPPCAARLRWRGGGVQAKWRRSTRRSGPNGADGRRRRVTSRGRGRRGGLRASARHGSAGVPRRRSPASRSTRSSRQRPLLGNHGSRSVDRETRGPPPRDRDRDRDDFEAR